MFMHDSASVKAIHLTVLIGISRRLMTPYVNIGLGQHWLR